MKRTSSNTKTASNAGAARFAGLRPSSARATSAARGASRKYDTRPEIMLRRALFARGLRYRVARVGLPGKPDVVFGRARVVVFCDGDFWHGRDLAARIEKLARGHNAPYWVAKITSNVERDRRVTAALESAGWLVLRYWETDIKKNAMALAREVAARVAARRPVR
jgi:DNA mismatch endonuclease (patch repair protein)